MLRPPSSRMTPVAPTASLGDGVPLAFAYSLMLLRFLKWLKLAINQNPPKMILPIRKAMFISVPLFRHPCYHRAFQQPAFGGVPEGAIVRSIDEQVLPSNHTL